MSTPPSGPVEGQLILDKSIPESEWVVFDYPGTLETPPMRSGPATHMFYRGQWVRIIGGVS